MYSDKNNLEICNTIEPNQIIDYLKKRSWEIKELKQEGVKLFEKILNDDEQEVKTQILLPDTNIFADYKYRIYEAIEIIAKIEKRPFISILNDIRLPPADIIRISVKNNDTTDGTITFEDGIELLKNAKKALIIAGYSSENPEKYFSRPFNSKTEEFINSCRLGQTEKGSYVVNIFSPLDGGAQISFADEKISGFGRKTMVHLMRSLAFLKKNIEEDTIPKVLTPSKEDITISSNFCEALLDLKPSSENYSINFKVTWAFGLEPNNILSEIQVNDSEMTSIGYIAKQLKPVEEDRIQEFVGRVAILKGKAEKNLMQGEVILSLLTEGESIRVKVNMSHEDYIRAGKFHTNYDNISIKGRLHKESDRVYELTNYSQFRQFILNKKDSD